MYLRFMLHPEAVSFIRPGLLDMEVGGTWQAALEAPKPCPSKRGHPMQVPGTCDGGRRDLHRTLLGCYFITMESKYFG